jgi:uncharacterized protein
MIGDVEVRDAGVKGQGVFARRAFAAGEFIFRRRLGPPLTGAEIAQLSDEDQRHLCELDWEYSAVLFPPGCYLNHSCEPNAMRSGVKVFAWRDVQAGDEITIDYRLNAFDDAERWPCFCGHCSGYVTGSFFSLDRARAEAYLPYAPRFIQIEYQRRASLQR